jgi:hypothetical protein
MDVSSERRTMKIPKPEYVADFKNVVVNVVK